MEEIKAFFSIKISSFRDKDLIAKYLIEREENGEVSVRLDTSAKQALPYSVNYPMQLLVGADGLVPMTAPDSFFQNAATKLVPAKETLLLLSKAAKLENIVQPYQFRQDADTDFPGTEKYFREELNYNTKKVIRQVTYSPLLEGWTSRSRVRSTQYQRASPGCPPVGVY